MADPGPSSNNIINPDEIGVGVDGYSGKPQISLPLFTLKSYSLSTKVSLQYIGGNGHKLADLSRTAGLGWVVKASGYVSRQVRGIRDEEPGGYFEMGQGTNTSFEEYYNSNLSTPKEILRDIGRGQKDASPDLYNLVADGYNINFTIRSSSFGVFEIVTLPLSEHRIQFINPDIPKQGFRLVTSEGVEYIFSIVSTGQDISNKVLSRRNQMSRYGSPYIYRWNLTKITDLKTNDFISFVYYENNEKHLLSTYNGYHTLSSPTGLIPGQYYNCPMDLFPWNEDSLGPYIPLGSRRYLACWSSQGVWRYDYPNKMLDRSNLTVTSIRNYYLKAIIAKSNSALTFDLSNIGEHFEFRSFAVNPPSENEYINPSGPRENFINNFYKSVNFFDVFNNNSSILSVPSIKFQFNYDELSSRCPQDLLSCLLFGNVASGACFSNDLVKRSERYVYYMLNNVSCSFNDKAFKKYYILSYFNNHVKPLNPDYHNSDYFGMPLVGNIFNFFLDGNYELNSYRWILDDNANSDYDPYPNRFRENFITSFYSPDGVSQGQTELGNSIDVYNYRIYEDQVGYVSNAKNLMIKSIEIIGSGNYEYDYEQNIAASIFSSSDEPRKYAGVRVNSLKKFVGNSLVLNNSYRYEFENSSHKNVHGYHFGKIDFTKNYRYFLFMKAKNCSSSGCSVSSDILTTNVISAFSHPLHPVSDNQGNFVVYPSFKIVDILGSSVEIEYNEPVIKQFDTYSTNLWSNGITDNLKEFPLEYPNACPELTRFFSIIPGTEGLIKREITRNSLGQITYETIRDYDLVPVSKVFHLKVSGRDQFGYWQNLSKTTMPLVSLPDSNAVFGMARQYVQHAFDQQYKILLIKEIAKSLPVIKSVQGNFESVVTTEYRYGPAYRNFLSPREIQTTLADNSIRLSKIRRIGDLDFGGVFTDNEDQPEGEAIKYLYKKGSLNTIFLTEDFISKRAGEPFKLKSAQLSTFRLSYPYGGRFSNFDKRNLVPFRSFVLKVPEELVLDQQTSFYSWDGYLNRITWDPLFRCTSEVTCSNEFGAVLGMLGPFGIRAANRLDDKFTSSSFKFCPSEHCFATSFEDKTLGLNFGPNAGSQDNIEPQGNCGKYSLRSKSLGGAIVKVPDFYLPVLSDQLGKKFTLSFFGKTIEASQSSASLKVLYNVCKLDNNGFTVVYSLGNDMEVGQGSVGSSWTRFFIKFGNEELYSQIRSFLNSTPELKDKLFIRISILNSTPGSMENFLVDDFHIYPEGSLSVISTKASPGYNSGRFNQRDEMSTFREDPVFNIGEAWDIEKNLRSVKIVK